MSKTVNWGGGERISKEERASGGGVFLFWRPGWFSWVLGFFLVPFLFLLAPFSSWFEGLGGFPGAWGSFCVPFLCLLVHFVFSVLRAVGGGGFFFLWGPGWFSWGSCSFLVSWIWGLWGVIFLFQGRGRFSWGSGVPFLFLSCVFLFLFSSGFWGLCGVIFFLFWAPLGWVFWVLLAFLSCFFLFFSSSWLWV